MALMRPRDLMMSFEPDGRVFLRSASRGVGAKAPPWAGPILALCSSPTEREQVVAAMGPQAGQLFDSLADAGLLVPPEEAAQTPVLFTNYAGIEVHRRMLVDEVRLDAYRRALEATVRPDDVVIDAGSGSGVLAVMAALAGARQVYALEQSDFAEMIPAVAAASGVGDRVEVIRGDFMLTETPQKARVLVTETFGAWAFAEDPVPDVGACAARNLREDGVVIPGGVKLWAAGMPSAPPAIYAPFRRREDGVDLTPLLPGAVGRGHIMVVDPETVGAAHLVADVRFPGPETIAGTLSLAEPCEALCCWYDLEMAPGITLSTSPHAPVTHWKQSVLPFRLNKGEHEVFIRPAPEDRRTLLIEIGGVEVRLR
ncbi:MAG: SAM-dependent methyltransferase [Myxococcota bacterium]|jgi:SAM-dependent methyltransferase